MARSAHTEIHLQNIRIWFPPHRKHSPPASCCCGTGTIVMRIEMERSMLPSALVSSCCSFWIILLLLKWYSPLWTFGLQYSRHPFLPVCGQRMPVACWHSVFCLLPAILDLSSSVQALKLSQSSILVFRRSILAEFETHGIMISVKLDACDRRLVGRFVSSISGTCIVLRETMLTDLWF